MAQYGFFDVNFMKSDLDAQLHAIRHELGHTLGLCRNREHGDGTHCYNRCLMNAWVDDGISTPLFKLLGASVKGSQLCGECLSDLEYMKTHHADNLTFSGPFFVRQEEGYAVTSLLGYYVIIPLEHVNKFDWQKTLSQIKMAIAYRVNSQLPTQQKRKAVAQKQVEIAAAFGLYNIEKGVDYNERIRDPGILEMLNNDPDWIIKGYALLMLEANRLEQVRRLICDP